LNSHATTAAALVELDAKLFGVDADLLTVS
jgi:hypothetical protein